MMYSLQQALSLTLLKNIIFFLQKVEGILDFFYFNYKVNAELLFKA